MAAKVLLVEDDQLIQRMYQKIFTFEGYEVVIASDGEDGLHKAQSERPAPTVILLDIMMPKMNGIQVLEKLQSTDATKAIPVIMLSNLAGDRDVETALSKGAVKYIIKSEYDPKEVADIVNEVVKEYTSAEI